MNCFVYYCIYGSKVWLQSVNLQVGPVPGLSSIIAPILQWNILDLLINTDIVIIIIPESEFRIHTYSCISPLQLHICRPSGCCHPSPSYQNRIRRLGNSWLQEDGSHNLHSPVFIEEKFMEERNNQFLQFKSKLNTTNLMMHFACTALNRLEYLCVVAWSTTLDS